MMKKEAIVFLCALCVLGSCGSHGSGFDRTRIDSAAHGNTVVLGRVRGFVKYHHPTFAGERFDADCELFELLPRVADAARP